METKKKAIAGVLVVAIALAGVAIAVSAEGGVQPMAIVPGSIQNWHLANDAVASNRIDDGALSEYSDFADGVVHGEKIGVAPHGINTTNINDDAVHGEKIADGSSGHGINATNLNAGVLPMVLNDSGTWILSTTNDTYTGWDSWNTTLDASGLSTTNTNIVIKYSAEGNVTGVPNELHVRCLIWDLDSNSQTIAYHNDIRFADNTVTNTTNSAVFYANVPSHNHRIAIQIRNTDGSNTVKLYNQTLVAVAYPA